MTRIGVLLPDTSELRLPLKAYVEAGGPVLSKTNSTQTTKHPKTGMPCLPNQGHAVGIT